MLSNLPVQNPKPDAKRFIDILMGKIKVSKPPLVEYLVDDVILKPIIKDLLGRDWVVDVGDQNSREAYLDNYIEFWYRMGYDFVRYERGLPFLEKTVLGLDVSLGVNKQRTWADQHHGNITTWKDFESFPWPKIEDYDFSHFEYINNHLPDGMGFMTCHAGGIFEHLSMIMSIEGLSLALCENPALVKAVVDEIGELIMLFYEQLLGLDKVIAIFQGDDMGFRTGTLISPAHLREYCLPWLKRLAEITHKHNIPFFLHSCGNLRNIMEDLIVDIKIDGKHSFEDAIIPVEEFQSLYGDRIAILGGMDVNILTTSSPEQVRKKTRWLMENCGVERRYAIGSGNSIPSYIPVPNYLAMIDETLRY